MPLITATTLAGQLGPIMVFIEPKFSLIVIPISIPIIEV